MDQNNSFQYAKMQYAVTENNKHKLKSAWHQDI